MSRLRPRIAIPGVLVAFAAATSAQVAHAAATRAEYVAQVEPICKAAQKPTIKAYASLFKGFHQVGFSGDNPDVSKRATKLGNRLIGTFYLRVSNVYGRTTAQIATVSAAPGDETAVAAWLAGRNRAVLLGAQAGRAARHQKVERSTGLVNKAESASEEAAKSVEGYGFNFCAFALGDVEF